MNAPMRHPNWISEPFHLAPIWHRSISFTQDVQSPWFACWSPSELHEHPTLFQHNRVVQCLHYCWLCTKLVFMLYFTHVVNSFTWGSNSLRAQQPFQHTLWSSFLKNEKDHHSFSIPQALSSTSTEHWRGVSVTQWWLWTWSTHLPCPLPLFKFTQSTLFDPNHHQVLISCQLYIHSSDDTTCQPSIFGLQCCNAKYKSPCDCVTLKHSVC